MLVLGLPGGTWILATVRSCQSLVLSNLFETPRAPLLVATFTECGCTWDGLSCVQGQLISNMDPMNRSANVSRPLGIHLHPPPPASPLSVLFMKKPVSDRAFGGIGRMGPLGFPLRGMSHSYFSWCLPSSQSHITESVLE